MKILSLPLLLTLTLLTSCTAAPPADKAPPPTPDEQEFNDSGRAKAVKDPKDLWTVSEWIQGEWISADDVNYLVVFSGNTKTDYYNGKITSEGNFTIDEDNLLVESEEETFRYSILKLSETKLELLHLPRGNILTFTR